MARVNRQWRLARRPSGRFEAADFTWHETPMGPAAAGEVLVRQISMSLDPAQRMWAAVDTYAPAVPLGEVMRGIGIGRVEESGHPDYVAGDLVQGMLGWQDYYTSTGRDLTKLPVYPGMPGDAWLGLFGHIGATAYFGLLDVGKPQPGETLVVSAAAGAVGSIVGQIGKIHGCRVVGIAGSDEKCRWIVDALGFDAAINYRTTPIERGLDDECPQGVDLDFENVGGTILDAVLKKLRLRGRVVICGLISDYTSGSSPIRNISHVLVQRARVEGFVVTDYTKRFPEAVRALAAWYAEGRVKYRIDAVDGLERAPEAINRLFDGGNIGKLVVRVSPDQ